MVSIIKMQIVQNKQIAFTFDDGTAKIIDFAPFIGEDEMSKPLHDEEYFRKVKLLENGRGIYWPNNFDFCPDFLHDYASESSFSMDVKKAR